MAEDQERRPSLESVEYLNDDEINEFLDDIDHNGDGFIDYGELKQKLEEAHDELSTQSNIHHSKRDYDAYDSHAFLQSIMGPDERRIPRHHFAERIRRWKIPSLQQVKRKESQETKYFQRLPSWRRMRAYWAVHGPEVVFLSLVVSSQIAFGVWQLVKYETSPYVKGFGWGFTIAKACSGALYPTFFFLILSTSRYFSTLLRRLYYISRFLNFDLSRNFHIRISCVALLLATLHGLSHLSGTFIHSSNPANWKAIAEIIGPGERHYIDYIRSVPGITGIIGLGLFLLVSVLSVPQIRRWNFNVFQLGHTLIYPIIGLMMAHGTSALFQQPLFGYFLAFPTLLVLGERLSRLISGFNPMGATLEVLNAETVEITVVIPKRRPWDYTAGQYIFLQVPAISFLQWHPFTISFCRGKTMKLHIKTDGDWTSKLRKLGCESGVANIQVAINGPFGAPAQRFYDFKHSVIIGAGIGITPFSAILADLQYKNDLDHGGPLKPDGYRSESNALMVSKKEQTETQSDAQILRAPSASDAMAPSLLSNSFPDDFRRTDFHWIVREKHYLLWLSDLLNRVSISQKWHREQHDRQSNLDIRINTHVTAKRHNLATYVYSRLLEMHRTNEHPASPLTGLLNPTSLGRPDFDSILDEHYKEVLKFCASERRKTKKRTEGKSSSKPSISSGTHKVGVFYCGATAVGEILADKCSELTIRGREDGNKIEYYFMMEVFG